MVDRRTAKNQKTNGHVITHLISSLIQAQNLQNLNTNDRVILSTSFILISECCWAKVKGSFTLITHIPSFTHLVIYQPNSRSQTIIISKESFIVTFSQIKDFKGFLPYMDMAVILVV